MSRSKLPSVITGVAILLLAISTFVCLPAVAQTSENVDQLKKKVLELTEQTRYTEALPLLEKLVVAEPKNSEMQFYLGFALIAQANITKDVNQAKALRVRALAAFVKAKELGNQEPLLDGLIQSLPPDGSKGKAFSENIAADSLMTEAEAFYSQGKLDEALNDYKKALEFDPKLYYAALFAGDVMISKDDYVQAEVWYKRAIAIDPNRETAYRYSATPLMKQGKTDAARDLYVEAFITEPYNKFATGGLIQWANVAHASLGHPAIEIPTNVTFDEKGDAKINLDASALLGSKEDGSFAWISYGVTRSTWKKEQFAKTFPNERAYRHSLPEEAEALRQVLTLAFADKKSPQTLTPSLQKLKKLNDEGLLEAFILLARPDEGIAQDHPTYLKQNRDKLRRYVIQYVVTGGGT